MPTITDVFLLDETGNIRASLNSHDYGNNYGDRTYFRQAIAGETAIVGPLVSRVTQKECVYIAVPVGNERNKGVLVAPWNWIAYPFSALTMISLRPG